MEIRGSKPLRGTKYDQTESTPLNSGVDFCFSMAMPGSSVQADRFNIKLPLRDASIMTVTWGEFAAQAPELEALGLAQFSRTGLALVGTLRRDGWPRISPVEPFIAGGQLFLGMMWRSVKALDLLRDPRCVVHSTVADKGGTEGEFKVYGRAREVNDPDDLRIFGGAVYAAIGMRVEDMEGHCFAIDIESVVFSVLSGEEFHRQVWKAGEA